MIWNIADSTFINSLITFLVGMIAIYLYKKAKRDEKRDAARVILAQIRHAEKQINRLISSQIDILIFDKILIENSWTKYCHLFVTILDSDDIDFITDFFSRCSCIDKCISDLSPSIQFVQKTEEKHKQAIQLAKDCNDFEEFKNKRDRVLKILNEDETLFIHKGPQEALIKLINSSPNITQSSTIQKLKRLAGTR